MDLTYWSPKLLGIPLTTVEMILKKFLQLVHELGMCRKVETFLEINW